MDTAVKAAFITKFPAFAQGLPDGGVLNVCIVGQDDFGAAIERAAATRVVVRRLPAVTPASGCHVAYVTGSARQSVREALAAVAGHPVLTITDAGAGGTRGMIHFVVAGERVRFHVDTIQAERSRLQLSSKLLALALSVRR
ncbi:YfiR family protein [Phenylobacterium sp. J426]|uniref:YfiR family protein n=1 Tax=Phenylobacterium sp. J426 TaxID=2898439 RepID=UPI0021511FCC|nr:YfiR family protein [Phenylobacterium sp. J426]MCR5874987.1 YfiR family protein [Phenylobacterium sp. J426]